MYPPGSVYRNRSGSPDFLRAIIPCPKKRFKAGWTKRSMRPAERSAQEMRRPEENMDAGGIRLPHSGSSSRMQ
ncbi:hypothetical protein DXA36_02710 [Eisenbergiella sp. OF01-20]|nr:hypothetical protein DXA36_02710 [Eisenbergiella sp. OF01-20]